MAEVGLDITQLVERIKGALDQGSELVELDLVARAEQFSNYCAAANARLLKCQTRLRQGHRSEAVRLAEFAPRLLEQVVLLASVPEEAWRALCMKLDLAVPPRLALKVAEELNEAYNVELAVRPVLAEFRRANLARIPLPERLELLRQLHRAEPNNPGWAADVLAFEQARLLEIERALADEEADLTIQDLRELHRELTQEPWQAAIPPQLSARLEARVLERAHHDAMPWLERALEPIDDAYRALDFPAAQQALEQWDRVAAGNRVPVPPAWTQRLAPVRAWIAGQQQQQTLRNQFSAAIGRLHQELDRPGGSRGLHIQWRQLNDLARSLNEALPEDLDRRYRAIVSRVELAERRRGWLMSAAALALVAALAAGAWLMLQRSLRAAEVRRWHDQITAALDLGQVAEAVMAWQNLVAQAPDLAADPVLQDDLRRIDQARADEQQRDEQLQALLAQATKLTQENPLLQQAVQSPDLFESRAGELDELLKQAESAVKTAGTLARGDGERIAVATLETQVRQYRSQWQAGVERPFMDKLRRINADLAALQPQSMDADPQQFRSRLNAVSEQLRILHDTVHVSEATRTLLTPVNERVAGYLRDLQRHLEVLDRRRQQQQALQSLRVASVDDLVADLNRFAEAYPASPHADDFRKAAGRADLWRSVFAWDPQIVGRWDSPAPRDADDLNARLAATEQYLRTHAESPLAGAVQRYRDYLQRARDAAPAWKSEFFETVLTNPRITDLEVVSVVRADQSWTYYVYNGGSFRQEKIGDIEYPTTFNAILAEDLRAPTARSFDPRKGFSITPPRPSPQSLMATDAGRLLSGLTLDNWPWFGADVAAVIAGAGKVDPLLRASLLEIVFEMTARHGWGLDVEIRRILAQLAPLRADRVNWLDPEDPGISRERLRAARTLDADFTPAALAKLSEVSRQRVSAMWARTSIGCRALGVLLRDEEGRWRLMPAQAVTGGEAVVRVVATSPVGGAELRVAGTIHDEKVELNPQALTGLPSGTLALICRRP